MQLIKSTILVIATLAMGISASTAGTSVAAVENDAAGNNAGIGCLQQGTPRKPALCSKPSCPGGYRSVFWDFGCPDGTWKCCI